MVWLTATGFPDAAVPPAVGVAEAAPAAGDDGAAEGDDAAEGAALVVVGVGTGASEDEVLLQPVNARAPTTAPTTIVA